MQSLCALQTSSNREFGRIYCEIESLNKKFEEDISAYKNRLEFIRIELFDQLQKIKRFNTDTNIHNNIKNRIINKKKYNDALKQGDIRLNVGCGHKPLPAYLNIDRRNLPGVDIVAEAESLPFEKNTVTEIFSAHLLEHFTLVQLGKNILPNWRDLLVENGVLQVVVPDAESMILAYSIGDMSFIDLREVTFGAQDYDDDFHQTMFTADTMKKILIESGFTNIKILASNRVNGKCREMEIKSTK
jgi:predicted SAM-dependent methyltransferase